MAFVIVRGTFRNPPIPAGTAHVIEIRQQHFCGHFVPPINSRMSSARHAVHRAEIFTAGGYLPDRTPAHHVDFPTGYIAGTGGSAFGSPIIWRSRKNPVAGRIWIIQSVRSQCGAIYAGLIAQPNGGINVFAALISPFPKICLSSSPFATCTLEGALE
jgi:hypothetical protein